MQDTSTALLSSNLILSNSSLLSCLAKNKFRVINKSQINTKESILPEVEEHKPDYLIISSSIPGVIEILEVVTRVKQISPKTKVVLSVNENDTSKILNLVMANTDAIIHSDSFNGSIEFALSQLTKGQTFLCGTTINSLKFSIQKQQIENKFDAGLLNSLTDREIEVLHSLTQGVNYKQIAKLLFISESTVKTHINNIFTKLNVNDRTQAVLYALHHGIDNLSKKPNLFKDLLSEPLEKNKL